MYVKKISDYYSVSSLKNNIRALLINYIVSFVILFSVTTIFQSLVDSISINKIVGGLLAFVSGILFLLNPKVKSFFCIVYFVINALFSIVITADTSIEINDFIFLIATVLMLIIMSDQRNSEMFLKAMRKRVGIINFTVIIECMVLGYLLLSQTGYAYHWGNGRYFLGLCNSQHTMASVACLIIAFILFLAVENKHVVFYGLMALIPAYTIFETGARVFLIPLSILFLLFVKIGFSKRYIRTIIYFAGILFAIFLLINSTMMNKLSFVFNNSYTSNAASAFTSGRSEFWKTDMELYLSGNPIQLLLGRTFETVYSTNLKSVNMNIWAHNDIIHLLVGTGLIGALEYIGVVYSAISWIKNKIDNRKKYFLMVIYIILPMLLNGFFTYQHFLYSFVILYIVVLPEKAGGLS